MLGSITEELVNRTIDWYWDKGIGFFWKAHVPVSINENIKIVGKANIDYYGVYKGRYIGFEVKETSKDYFLLSQIKPHQKEILLSLEEAGAVSFLLLNFVSFENSTYLIFADQIRNIYASKMTKILLKDMVKIGIRIFVVYPGVLDLTDVLEHAVK